MGTAFSPWGKRPTSPARAPSELGDSPKSLNYPHLVPMFVGIALGILLGSWAFSLPGFRAGAPGPGRGPADRDPSRIGRIGPLVWYMPLSANYMLREVGIVLFLCAVGLHAGDVFVDTLLHGPGLYWMAGGSPGHRGPAGGGGHHRPGGAGPELPDPLRAPAGSMTDPPALDGQHGGGQRGPVNGLRHRLPADDDPTRPRRAALRPVSGALRCPRGGEALAVGPCAGARPGDPSDRLAEVTEDSDRHDRPLRKRRQSVRTPPTPRSRRPPMSRHGRTSGTSELSGSGSRTRTAPSWRAPWRACYGMARASRAGRRPLGS